MDTIYALSSGAPPAGVAVVRVSGPRAGMVLQHLAGRLPVAGRLALRAIRSDRLLLDRALVYWRPGPGTFTGEDVCELHLHGSRAVVRAVFDSLAKQGLRPAEPGEFTRRAFDNGRLDLTEVEGLADLVAAETELQRRQALSLSQGRLREAAESWRETLIELRAEVEARLDFSEEGDVPAQLPGTFYDRVARLRGTLEEAVQGAATGEIIRDGFRVAIAGRPNAGKSSLLNALARRDVAIVTAEPGTTRDVLEVSLDLNGYPVRLFDTAGLRDAQSSAEQEGVRRARSVMDAADLVLWIEDCTQPGETVVAYTEAPMVRMRSKIDLAPSGGSEGLGVSSTSGAGIPELLRLITEAAERSVGRASVLLTRERQKQAVQDAAAALEGTVGAPDEVVAHLLRTASESIGRLTGRVDVEQVLDRLFGEFCIGK